MHMITRLSLLAVLLLPAASARTWTDTTGKKIEAELVTVEGDKVVLKFKGKDTRLALERLSAEDRKFVAEWQKSQTPDATPPATPDATPADPNNPDMANPDGTTPDTPPAPVTPPPPTPPEIKLGGTVLFAGGGANTVMSPLPPEVLKAYSKARTKPTQAKIRIALPAGFDPAKPQYVLWVCCPVNNENDRKNGNTGGMGEYVENGVKAGYVVIAADTDIGHPTFSPDDRSEGGDYAFHKYVVSLLAKDWPASKTWKWVAGGFSGGSKLAFVRAGELLGCGLDVTGMFLAGCNEDRSNQAKEETSVRRSALKKVRVFMSSGKQDDVATPEKMEAVKKSLEGNGYGEITMDSFDGPHTIGQASYAKALEWFKQAPKK